MEDMVDFIIVSSKLLPSLFDLFFSTTSMLGMALWLAVAHECE